MFEKLIFLWKNKYYSTFLKLLLFTTIYIVGVIIGYDLGNDQRARYKDDNYLRELHTDLYMLSIMKGPSSDENQMSTEWSLKKSEIEHQIFTIPILFNKFNEYQKKLALECIKMFKDIKEQYGERFLIRYEYEENIKKAFDLLESTKE